MPISLITFTDCGLIHDLTRCLSPIHCFHFKKTSVFWFKIKLCNVTKTETKDCKTILTSVNILTPSRNTLQDLPLLR